MPPATKTYLFTHAETGTVLATKRALRQDYSLDLPGVSWHALVSGDGLPPPGNLALRYRPASGFSPAELTVGQRSELELLKKKVECALFFRVSCALLKTEIRKSLSAEAAAGTFLEGRALRSYLRLVKGERKITLKRVNDFFRGMQARIAAAGSAADLDAIMVFARDNVNLGVYSVANQERKRISG